MINKIIGKDRFGNEIKIGTDLIICDYDRNATLYVGTVQAETDKTIKLDWGGWGTRVIKKQFLSHQAIVKPKNYVKKDNQC